MNDIERGMMKWLPFASVANPNELVNNIIKEKSKRDKPILSEDDYKEIEENILFSYQCGGMVKIYYYKNGYIYKEESVINKINTNKKIIILENNKTILFNSIIRVEI